MTTTSQADSSVRKTHLLKLVAINPDSKIVDMAKEVGLSKSQAYNILQEFAKAYVMTEDEQNFPQKILYYYNNDLPSDVEPLDAGEVKELKTVVDRIMKRTAVDPDEVGTNTIPTTDGQAINRPNTENSYSKMSANKEPDLTTNESLLVNILQNQKNVQPSVIAKFMNMYRMNEQIWAAYPEKMLASMRAFFGPMSGETAFNLFRDAAPNFVPTFGNTGNGNGGGGMDPMLMTMLMGGGGGNMAAMLPFLMGGNANPAMLQQVMLANAQKEQEKKQAKEAQLEFMDRALQVAMMKMVSGAADDKRPLDPMALGQQTGMPFSVREELDDSGRARARVLQPFVGGAAQNQRDPLLETMLKSQLDRENMLIQQQLRSNEPIKDLFFQLIPNFKTNSDPIAMLSQVRQAFPELWQKPEDRNSEGNIEALRLKTDTQLAIQEQQIQLEQMKHGWKLEEQDRASSQENAKGWMDMLSTLGEKIAIPLAQNVMTGFGGGMLNKNGGGQQAQQQQQMQQQAIIQEQRRRQMMAAQEQHNAELLADQRARENQTPPAPQTDPTVIMALTQMQEKLKQQEEYIQQQNMRYAQMVQQMQTQSRQQQQVQQQTRQPTAADIDDSKIAQLPTAVLQEAYHDYLNEKEMNEKIGSKLEVELANREIYEGKNLNNQQQQVINPQPQEYYYNPNPTRPEVISQTSPPQVITGPLPQAPPSPVYHEPPKAPVQQVIPQQVIEEQSDDLDMEPITDEEQARALERGDGDNRLADSQVIAQNEQGMTARRDSQVINPPSISDDDETDDDGDNTI